MRVNFYTTVLLSGAFSLLAAQAPPKLVPEVPYVPTPTMIVEAMLKLAGVTSRDNVYDLGCGDGRIVITAAKEYKAHGGDRHQPAAHSRSPRQRQSGAGGTSRAV